MSRSKVTPEQRIEAVLLEHELYIAKLEHDILKKLEDLEKRDEYRK